MELMIFINFSGSTQIAFADFGTDETLECVFSTDCVQNGEADVYYDAELSGYKFIMPSFCGRIYRRKIKCNKITL